MEAPPSVLAAPTSRTLTGAARPQRRRRLPANTKTGQAKRGNGRKLVGDACGRIIDFVTLGTIACALAYYGVPTKGALVKLLKRIVVILAIATVVAVGLSLVAPNLFSLRDLQGFFNSPAENIQHLADKGTSKVVEVAGKAAEKAQNEAVNKLVDQTGLKEAAVQELHAHAEDIAYATGLDSSMVDYVIDSMNIPSWQTTTLPEDAYATTSVPFTYEGTNATLTTYDDPGYMTVEAYGQSVTFAVPEGAQGCIGYLSYVNY